MFLLKTTIPFLAIICLLTACNQQAKTPVPASPDSMAYAPASPQAISKQKLRHYNNACSSFFDSLLLRRGAFNGSILVAKDGNIVYEKYAGFSNLSTKKDSLGINSAFHLASVSKTFTAMAVLKLWEQGRLNIEDSLGKYFPNFPYRGITIKMLLNHRSGLPNYVHYLELNGWDKRKMVNNVDVLTSLYMMKPPLEFPSGKHFSYCNTNYALLALVIEKVSGQRYADFLNQTFFTPLQMRDSYVFSLKDTARAMPSFEYNNRPFKLEFLDAVYGDKNIYSTVRDMLKWDQALYAGSLFKQATLDSAFAGYSFEKQGKRNYGLGWRMTFLDNGKKLLYHNGWWHGNNTAFIRLTDEKATIIVLGNKFNRRIYASKHAADIFGNYMQNNNSGEELENTSTGGGEPTNVAKIRGRRRH
ncbi:MAG: serine hydrolase domain-containing protein [Chitinophagaceae bacterium]